MPPKAAERSSGISTASGPTQDIREQYEAALRETREALGEAHLQIYALKRTKRLLDEDENSCGRCRRSWPGMAVRCHSSNCVGGWGFHNGRCTTDPSHDGERSIRISPCG